MASTSRLRRWWTEEEDQILRQEAHYQLNQGSLRDWNRIAAKLPGRTNKDCRKRWSKVCDNVKKGAWSAAEDEQLKKAVEELGFRWTHVARRVGSRQADQCAKRWYHSLDPTLDRREWCAEDDARLLAAVGTLGRKWKSIRETEFPHRSSMDIKNRHVILERRLQQEEKSPESLDFSELVSGLKEPGDPDLELFGEASVNEIFCSLSDLDQASLSLGLLSGHESPFTRPTSSMGTFSSATDELDDIAFPESAFNMPPAGSPMEQLDHSYSLQSYNSENIDPMLWEGAASDLSPASGFNQMENSQQSTMVLEDLDTDAIDVVMKAVLDSRMKVRMRLFSQ